MSAGKQGGLFTATAGASHGPVECLGEKFESEEARRIFFTNILREKLRSPEFRRTPGFPSGSDEDILRLSDPPYYTACPNPFLEEFVRHRGTPYEPAESYHRDPFAVDVSVGKSDALYKAHGYHTKVPHLAIVPSILHYTRPGDIVLDGFCGSGMTGVASQWCGTAPIDYRRSLESNWKSEGRAAPKWGARCVVVGDLSPAATFISAGYNLPMDVAVFEQEARRILKETESDIGWMYETSHTDGRIGRINFTVWSEVFACPECAGDIVFTERAVDFESKRVREQFSCPDCGANVNKNMLDLRYDTVSDGASDRTVRTPKRVPVLIAYSVDGTSHEKRPDAADLNLVSRIAALPMPDVPQDELPDMQMARVGRMKPAAITHIHHFFLPRHRHSLATLWRKAAAVEDTRLRNAVLYFVEQAIWTCSVLNRYRPTGYSQVSQYLSGVFYVPSQHSELAPWTVLDGKLGALKRAFSDTPFRLGDAAVTTGDCAVLPLPPATIDYIFTDPPFGENIYYSDLNFLVEAWHRVRTDPEPEAIVDRVKRKGVHEYQDLMRRCFEEYHRVLKPGRWMTVVFSNASNAVWRAIQEAMGTAGFVVADVRTLDKQQGSFRQVTSSAVKQDLVISAYKPTEGLEQRFNLDAATPEAVWAFVTEHLGNVMRSPGGANGAAVIAERTPQMLLDRMIAFFVQRRVAVPISGPDFLVGLAQRFPERDGMYFLPEQVAEYDRQRAKITELKQLELFVTDEASAIQWLRQRLQDKPQTLQDLTPVFIREIQAWAKHEQTVELREILGQNFLKYDGSGPVPSQIHSYLSTAYHNLRGLDKTNARLIEMARDRWYVPDPSRQAEREKLRDRELLKEFEEYRTSKKKLKQFRTEAVRAGFKAAYDRQDYRTIVDVAGKLPESVLQEDEKLLMYYDVASMRVE
jgi:hypothetical protein